MKHIRIESLVICAGLVVLGIFIYFGFATLATRDRSVEVRGFSERTVKANKVVWPIPFKNAGGDLNDLYDQSSRSMTLIRKYLRQNGVPDSEITVSSPQVNDNWSEGYANHNQVSHYTIKQVCTVTSSSVDRISGLMGHMQELLKMGVPVSSDYSNAVSYEYTLLDSIKPQMIAEATHSARAAAEKFARDSESRIGKIRHATQGYFSIEDRDQYTPYIKRVRVVTTVDYYLKN